MESKWEETVMFSGPLQIQKIKKMQTKNKQCTLLKMIIKTQI